MKSILHKVTRGDVIGDPFPHVVVDGALEESLYAELMSAFPSAEEILDGRDLESNAPYRMPAARLLSSDVSPLWQDFVRYHTSAAFYAEVCAIFGLPSARTSVRGAEPFADVALDCQPCWGTPVTVASSSDPCHVDRPVTLYAGLLYCRLPGDDAVGGDLELYRFRGPERRYDATRHVDASLVEPVERIPYAANRLVFFLQSAEALHGVTVRQPTRWPRLHVNFLAERETPTFSLVSCGAAAASAAERLPAPEAGAAPQATTEAA